MIDNEKVLAAVLQSVSDTLEGIKNGLEHLNSLDIRATEGYLLIIERHEQRLYAAVEEVKLQLAKYSSDRMIAAP